MKQFVRAHRRIMRWTETHTRAADALFAAVIGVAALIGHLTATPTGSERTPDALAVATIIGGATALAFRRTHPMRALLAVMICTTAFWVGDYATNFDVYSVIALYSATAYSGVDRRWVWRRVGAAVAAFSAIALAGVLSPSEDLPAVAILGITVIHLTAAIVGEVMSTRRQRVAELQERAERAESERETLAHQAVLSERARIARDLHDVVAHGMSVMVIQAGAAERLLVTDTDMARSALQNIQSVGREALSDMRRMLSVLRDGAEVSELSPQPTLRDVEAIVRHCVDSGVPTTYTIDGQVPEGMTGPEIAGYRIVQEALTNVVKHGGRPVRADVKIRCFDDHLRVEVNDDGVGATTQAVDRSVGHGLIGMRERVELYGGIVYAGPRSGGGFRVAATIPFAGQATNAAPTDDRATSR
jgi:signal transduction histidine kinase